MHYTPEQLIQLDCCTFVRLMCPQVLLSASQNGLFIGAKNKAAYINKMKMLGMLVGESDLMLTWPDRGILFCELKAGKNKTTDSQDGVMTLRQLQGFDCFVAYSLIEFVAGLKRFRVPMRTGIYAGVGRV